MKNCILLLMFTDFQLIRATDRSKTTFTFLNPIALELLPVVSHFSKDFYLVGGTAIALYLGHRASIDFDNEEELKIDIMETDKFIKPQVNIDGIRFAHIEDIAAMKLEAITSRNTKKDFYDIAELLKT